MSLNDELTAFFRAGYPELPAAARAVMERAARDLGVVLLEGAQGQIAEGAPGAAVPRSTPWPSTSSATSARTPPRVTASPST
ncbi:hypothetical protein [Streptomyces sp. BP-8]|uniref:Uncharacterized protein n=1 Tax=Streptomyces sirii TaxID=3127701 RepID=A0ABZ2QTQ5_9ACTN